MSFISSRRLAGALLLAAAASALPARAQIEREAFRESERIDPRQTRELRLAVDNLLFFKDNEFGGDVVKGYSLPGLWLRPRLTYQPLRRLRLEVGLHALVYHGASKYPCYAYSDIAHWKGGQYQRGAHVLPFVRAQLRLRHADLVLGHLYGQSNHRLLRPLYNPELDLTSDPDAGFQVIMRHPHNQFDMWVNWQSYQFETDTHQEAFTLGLSDRIDYTHATAPVHVYSPVQLVGQHRGGEQDTIKKSSVQTLINGAIGLGLTWHTGRRVLSSVTVEADVLGSYQQAGHLWPYDTGVAAYGRTSVQLSDFSLTAGYFWAHRFVSLYGSPYFSSLSAKVEGATFRHPQTAFLLADYARTFGRHYTLGANFELYYTNSRTLTEVSGLARPSASRAHFAAGVYFKASPSFLLKKWLAD